jgi:hypothetical protein
MEEESQVIAAMLVKLTTKALKGVGGQLRENQHEILYKNFPFGIAFKIVFYASYRPVVFQHHRLSVDQSSPPHFQLLHRVSAQ